MKHHNLFIASIIALLFIYGCAAKTPLIKASADGDYLVVQRLINEGANINEPDSRGYTPLMHAIFKRNTEVAKYLIQVGADVKYKDQDGYSALTYAINYRQHDLIKILLSKGIDIESKDCLGETALVHAVLRAADFDAAKMLIKSGADIKAKSYEGETVLDIYLSSLRREILDEPGVNLLSPETGKARLIFVGRELHDFYIKVSVENQTKTLNQSTFEGLAFIDVDPGKHDIYAYTYKNVKFKQSLPIEVMAGKTYYFKVTQDKSHRMVHYTGFKLSSAVITPLTITETEAKEEITKMLKSYEIQ